MAFVLDTEFSANDVDMLRGIEERAEKPTEEDASGDNEDDASCE